ncbi:MAG: hypothetical protein PHD74_10700, partial [Candidatus Krumholzibacteria bacterium]|nr:hypothetical protein [Candidatus Krumholzibacteria bacterium]
MRSIITKSMLILLTLGAVMIAAQGSVMGQCSTPWESQYVYRTYYHNSGLHDDCTQDCDMDLAEYFAFLSDFSQFTATSGSPVIGDGFQAVCDPEQYEKHADVVLRYLHYSNDGSSPYCVQLMTPWYETIDSLVNNQDYHRRVANFSNGASDEWPQEATDAIMNAYNHGIVIVGPLPAFFPPMLPPRLMPPDSLGDNMLVCMPMDAEGQYCCAGHVPDTNRAEVGVPTNWYKASEDHLFLANTGRTLDCNQAYEDEGNSGSYSTALFSGTVQRIADVVLSRNVPEEQFVSTVLDYVISSCDRNVDPETYEIFLQVDGQPISYGPWSPTWGYGVFSAWKALIYAYGWGVLQPEDSALDPGSVTNPHTVFSDRFQLRGDLVVPAGETFEVGPLANIFVDANLTPEGPSSLGHLSGLCEIRVEGNMLVQSCEYFGVESSITIDSGGLCTVA